MMHGQKKIKLNCVSWA